jgi:hypothetical protein
MPSADVAREYKEVLPSSVDRMFRMAERTNPLTLTLHPIRGEGTIGFAYVHYLLGFLRFAPL